MPTPMVGAPGIDGCVTLFEHNGVVRINEVIVFHSMKVKHMALWDVEDVGKRAACTILRSVLTGPKGMCHCYTTVVKHTEQVQKMVTDSLQTPGDVI